MVTVDDTVVPVPSGVGTDSDFAGTLVLTATPTTSAPGLGNTIVINGWAVDVGNVAPQAGQTVTFSVENGPGINPGLWGIIDSTAAVAANGSFSATYRAAPLAGSVTIQAWLGSVTQAVVVDLVGAPASGKSGVGSDSDFAGTLLVEASPATIAPGLENVVTLSGWAVDIGNVAPQAVQAVTFSIDNGPGANPGLWGIIDSQASIASNGSFSASYRAAEMAGAVTVTVWLGSSTKSVVITVDDSVVVDPTGVGTDAVFSGTLLLRATPTVVRSGAENTIELSGWAVAPGNVPPGAGLAVTFSVDNGPGVDPGEWGIVDPQASVASNGAFTATYRAAESAGAVTITAWLGSATKSVVITVDDTVVPDPTGVGTDANFSGTLLLSATPDTLRSGAANTLTLSGWAIANGNVPPDAGLAVTFSIDNGPGANPGLWGIVDPQASLAANGSFSATYRAAESAGAVTITAWLGTSSQSVVVTIDDTVVVDPTGVGTDSDFTGTLLMSGNPTRVALGLNNTVTLSGWAVGSGNIAAPAGQAVTFSVDSGPGANSGLWGIISQSATISSNGSFTATYRAATVAGSVSVSAWLGTAVTTVTLTVADRSP
ncbi:MAG: hypothetical protein KJ052_22210, partial [Candidatus Hydrogenedentes bacterium]|nr:hypothetical protein [Candidatus Hydrogenedentota bacterium]